jgi:hypothetical protein
MVLLVGGPITLRTTDPVSRNSLLFNWKKTILSYQFQTPIEVVIFWHQYCPQDDSRWKIDSHSKAGVHNSVSLSGQKIFLPC